MKYIFVINPVAGKGSIQNHIINNIKDYFENIEQEYEIYITKFKGDAKEYVSKRCDEI
ncbi:MAG: hypothetical protein K0Q97_2486, partial [Bacillota bacterium]|nr:hypothetical protein [Bacillota bacterium]